MATSHTKRKRSKNKKRHPMLDHPQVDAVLTEAVRFLHHWTQRELNRLNNNGQVLILPGRAKDDYLVGKYRLHKYNDRCWTVTYDEKTVHDFYDRRAAMFYCMGTQGGHYTKKANEILMLDAVVGKLSSDWAQYAYTMALAKKHQNWLQYDAMQARISEISSKLDYVQDQLEKSLKWAKYMKSQDESHETTRIRN